MAEIVEQGTSQKSLRGIPTTDFLENVDNYMKGSDGEGGIEAAIKKMEEAHQKYKFIEANMMHQKARLRSKLPELKNSLSLLSAIEEKRDQSQSMNVNFVLSDQCYMSANVPPTNKVCLWLGANVMLEYSAAEARELLEKNIENAQKGIDELINELDFVKDQLTTTEVNIARIYNYGVQQRKTVVPS